MKRILLFIGLKVAEIAGTVLIVGCYPYWLGKYLLIKYPSFWDDCPRWIAGFLFTGFVALCIFTIYQIGYNGGKALCKANWEWAGKILKRKQ